MSPAAAARDGPRGRMRALRLMRDQRIAAHAARGDRDAFGELFRRHHQPVYRLALVLLGDAEDAADVLQTTMLSALGALEEGHEVKRVRPWLLSIARNRATDVMRGQRTAEPIDKLGRALAHPVPDVAEQAEGRVELASLITDLQELPERQRSALVLRELSGLSHEEIAEVLGTSVGATRQLVYAARSALDERGVARETPCEPVRAALSANDGGTPRARQLRAHLKHCPDCQRFQKELRTRPDRLSMAAGPLAPAAAAHILETTVGGGSGPGTTSAIASATGGATKLTGAAGVKVAAGAAATALVIGGVVAVRPGDDVDDPRPRATGIGQTQPLNRLGPPPGARAAPDRAGGRMRTPANPRGGPPARSAGGLGVPAQAAPTPINVPSVPAPDGRLDVKPPELGGVMIGLGPLLERVLRLDAAARRQLLEIVARADPRLAQLLRQQFEGELGPMGQQRLEQGLDAIQMPTGSPLAPPRPEQDRLPTDTLLPAPTPVTPPPPVPAPVIPPPLVPAPPPPPIPIPQPAAPPIVPGPPPQTRTIEPAPPQQPVPAEPDPSGPPAAQPPPPPPPTGSTEPPPSDGNSTGEREGSEPAPPEGERQE